MTVFVRQRACTVTYVSENSICSFSVDVTTICNFRSYNLKYFATSHNLNKDRELKRKKLSMSKATEFPCTNSIITVDDGLIHILLVVLFSRQYDDSRTRTV